MKKTLLLLLLIPLIGKAQNTMLFELSKKGIKQKSYLFGTIHMQDEAAFTFNDSVFWAIDQCKNAAFELDFKETRSTDFGDVFRELKSDEFRDKAATYFVEEMMPQLMESFTADELSSIIEKKIIPPYVDLLTARFKADKRAFFVDQYLQAYAYQNKKQVIGIESYEEQMTAILGDLKDIKVEEIGDFILASLKDDNLSFNLIKSLTGSQELLEIYTQRDQKRVCDFVSTYEASNNKLATYIYERIFYERNGVMYNRTIDAVKKEGIFIAVGAGHLCGDNGLLAQYQKAGYSIRPVNTSNPYKRETKWEVFEGDGFTVELPQGVTLSNSSPYYYNYAPFENLNYAYMQNGAVTFEVEEYYEYETEDEIDYVEQAADAVAALEDAVAETEELEYEETEYIYVNPTSNEEEYLEVETEVIDGYLDYGDEEVTESYSAEEIIAMEEAIAEVEEYAVEGAEEVSKLEYDLYGYEDFEEYETGRNSSSVDEMLTEDQLAYLKAVGDTLEVRMKDFKSPAALQMEMMEGPADISQIVIGGKSYDLVYAPTFFEKALSVRIPTGELTYRLTVKGDAAALKSEEVKRFFTSFQVAE